MNTIRRGWWGRRRAAPQYDMTPGQWERSRRDAHVWRVAVLGAAGPAGANVCRSLFEAGLEVVAVDGNAWRLPLVERWSHRRVLMGSPTVDAVNALDADVVLAQPDGLALWLADHDQALAAATLLPDRRTIALCQDKFSCGLVWRRAGLRTDEVLLVEDLYGVRDAYIAHRGRPFWLRARHGAGARGAILANSIEEAEHWFGFWQLRDPLVDFVAEEHLPGRDFAWTSVWNQGELVTSFVRERLEYIYPALSVSGLTGTPTVARIVHDDDVHEMARAAVLEVDEFPHGVMSVDLREDADGVPRPTEINAGRFFTTSYLATAAGRNMAELVVNLALGEPAGEWPRKHVLPEGALWVRHIDMGSRLLPPEMPLCGVESVPDAFGAVTAGEQS